MDVEVFLVKGCYTKILLKYEVLVCFLALDGIRVTAALAALSPGVLQQQCSQVRSVPQGCLTVPVAFQQPRAARRCLWRGWLGFQRCPDPECHCPARPGRGR